MKSLFKLIGIAALVTVIGFSMIACDNGTTTRGGGVDGTPHTHQWGEWAVTTAATCAAEGVETRICTLNSSHKETRSIAIDPNAPHQWVARGTPTLAPTCTEDGIGAKECELCGIKDDNPNGVIPAFGHDWSVWTVTTFVTEITDGVETRTCSHDPAHKETRTIPAAGIGGTPGLEFSHMGVGDGYYQVSKGTVTTGAVVIPATYNDRPVTRIGDFSRTDITIVNIPEGVTSIDRSYAFMDCTSLTSINIPSSVTSISHGAFMGCSSLTSITIPEGVTSIGYGTFSGTGLTSITIPEGVTSIDNSAFSNCSNLTGITVNANNAHYVSQNGILYDKPTTQMLIIPPKIGGSVTIRDGVMSIGTSAFSGYAGITSITIPNSVTSIGNYAFMDCTSLASITIPNSVTSIGSQAFTRCTNLTSVTIGAGVTSISNNAFSGCSNLTGITVDVNNAHYASQNGILYNKPTTQILFIPPKIGGSVTILDGVTSIGTSAFSGYAGITSITIPATVTSIGTRAFNNCTGFTSVTLPVTTISNDAFSGCNNIKTVTFTNGSLTTIASTTGAWFNSSKSSITTITIPANVTSIGDNAFSGYTGLTSVIFAAGSGLQTIGAGAFSGCTGLTGITIPAGVTSIGASAFQSCTSLTSVTIPANVTSIGVSAFQSCTGLTSVTFAAGSQLKTIGNGAFSGCTGITSITIPVGVTSIGNDAFRNCTKLTGVTIQSGVTSIGNYAFYNCTSLTSITIPVGVTSIGNNAFSGCTGIISITIPSSVTRLGDGRSYVFSEWGPSQTINIQGKANQAQADAAWGGDAWRKGSYSYQGGVLITDIYATINYIP